MSRFVKLAGLVALVGVSVIGSTVGCAERGGGSGDEAQATITPGTRTEQPGTAVYWISDQNPRSVTAGSVVIFAVGIVVPSPTPHEEYYPDYAAIGGVATGGVKDSPWFFFNNLVSRPGANIHVPATDLIVGEEGCTTNNIQYFREDVFAPKFAARGAATLDGVFVRMPPDWSIVRPFRRCNVINGR